MQATIQLQQADSERLEVFKLSIRALQVQIVPYSLTNWSDYVRLRKHSSRQSSYTIQVLE